jgi:hypothetical protein
MPYPILSSLTCLAVAGLRLAADTSPPPVFSSPAPAKATGDSSKRAGSKPLTASPDIAAALADMAPKYAPPKYKKAAEVDLRTTDKPRNQIPRLPVTRLPTYIVREHRYPELTERDVYTEKALLEIAEKRYLSEFDYKGLNKFELFGGPWSKEGRAMYFYERDEMKELTDELGDFAGLEKSAPPPSK